MDNTELTREVKELRDEVATLVGKVATLERVVLAKLDGVHTAVDQAAGIKQAMTYAAIVIVPILVAIIGGYFAIKAASPR